MRWTCEGPFSRGYEVRVTAVKDGMARYDGAADGQHYWIEQSVLLTGTSLWSRKIHDQMQWFHWDDFDGLAGLVPGSRYRGAVPAIRGYTAWVWDYEVHVDQPEKVDHSVLGAVTLATLVEQRKIYHGDYWSRMRAQVLPERGITVRWTFEDPAGTERCDLVEMKQDQRQSGAGG